mmetsp:Transcript_135907/g.290465  ORF Transcript_135907/g.290465 Transcript_135907/m.290465 type:complete len:459 (-) Transcript_135907:86-1462(-)
MSVRVAFLLLLATPAASIKFGPASKTRRETSAYFWPEPRGTEGSYSVSPYMAPRNLNGSLAWTWSNGGPEEKYSTAVHLGLLIDDKEDIYLSSTDGIRKFSADGDLLWFYRVDSNRIPSLYEGAVYTTSKHGQLVVVSMQTGKLLWSRKFTNALGTDISGVGVHDGVVVAESHMPEGGGATYVTGMDATHGRLLWQFPVEATLWNFMPMFTEDDTFVFQDSAGGSYHYSLKDGKRIWKTGFLPSPNGDMTDGLTMVADGVVYTVHSDGPCCAPNGPANLRAYDLNNGELLWQRDFSHPANSQGAVGHLGQGAGLSKRLAVVMPIGAQPGPHAFPDAAEFNTSIAAFDAKTGAPIWEWTPPEFFGTLAQGDEQRSHHGNLCFPNPYASPTIDARGTVYTGHFNGVIYAIRDDNGDNIIQDSEVSKFDTGAAFSHGGAAIAPGMLAIPSCDTLYVFKTKV